MQVVHLSSPVHVACLPAAELPQQLLGLAVQRLQALVADLPLPVQLHTTCRSQAGKLLELSCLKAPDAPSARQLQALTVSESSAPLHLEHDSTPESRTARAMLAPQLRS